MGERHSTRYMIVLNKVKHNGKESYYLCKTWIKFYTKCLKLSQVLLILGQYGSEVYYFIPEPRKFAEVTRLSDYIKKP